MFLNLKQMCIWCVLEWILFSGKEGQGFWYIYRETEIQSSVLMKWSKRHILKSFSSSFSFSLWHPYPSLNKLRKVCIKVVKHVSFCFCTDQKDVTKNVYEVNLGLGGELCGNCLFLHAGGWEIDLQERKNLQILRAVGGGGKHSYK